MIHHMRCPQCSKDFTSKRCDAQYCSNICRCLAWRERLRAHDIRELNNEDLLKELLSRSHSGDTMQVTGK